MLSVKKLIVSLIISTFFKNSAHYVGASSAAGTETLIGVVGDDFVMLGADSSVSQSIVLTSSDIDKIQVVVDPFPEGNKIRNHRQQQAIVVATAGDFADADRLVSILKQHAAIREYEAGIGCDVDIVDLKRSGKGSMIIPPGLSVSCAARLARGKIAQSLRSPSPLKIGVLIAGMQNERSNFISSEQELHSSGGELASISGDVQKQLERISPTSTGLIHGNMAPAQEITDSGSVTSTLRPHLYWLDEYGSLQKLKYASHGLGSNFLLAILDQGYKENLSRAEAAELIRDCFRQLQIRYLVNSPKPAIIKCVDGSGCHFIN